MKDIRIAQILSAFPSVEVVWLQLCTSPHPTSTFLTMSFTSPRPRLVTRRELIRNTSDTCQRGPALKWPWWRFHWVSQPHVDVIHSPVASQIHLSDINPSVKRRGRLLKLARIAGVKKKKNVGLIESAFIFSFAARIPLAIIYRDLAANLPISPHI